jgi:hypothetical protein
VHTTRDQPALVFAHPRYQQLLGVKITSPHSDSAPPSKKLKPTSAESPEKLGANTKNFIDLTNDVDSVESDEEDVDAERSAAIARLKSKRQQAHQV